MVTTELLNHIIPPWPLKLTDRRPGGRNDWYFCQICMRAYPIFWVPETIWRESGFKRKSVCKHCFEARVPHPKYCTVDEYMKERIYDLAPIEKEQRRNALLAVWDQPEENAPEPRTPEEIKGLLSIGECTIQYATTPAEVKEMCKLCARQTCIGPYALGEWEEFR